MICSMFQAGRFIMGMSVGVMVTVTPMYLSEMASPLSRGWLVGHHAIFLVFGYMLSSWIGYGVYFADSHTFSWRFPLCFQVLPPLVLLIGSPWVPRSPRWLMSKGRKDEAWTVLQRLRKSADDPNDLVAKEELYQIEKQLELDHEKLTPYGGNPWKAVLQKKSYRKRMIIGFLTQWGAEFGGPLIIVRIYFSSGVTIRANL
jgi:MFS family permease